MMKYILKFFISIILFILFIWLFFPKTYGYYYIANLLSKDKIILSLDNISENLVGLDIENLNINYDKIDIASISKVDIKSYLYKTDIKIASILIDQSMKQFIPNSIRYIKISHSLLDPLNIYLESKFNNGICKGTINLIDRKIVLKFDITRKFRSKYHILVKRLKQIKNKNGKVEYSYEYRF